MEFDDLTVRRLTFMADACSATVSQVIRYAMTAVAEAGGWWLGRAPARWPRVPVHAVVAGQRIDAAFDRLAVAVVVTSGRLAGQRFALPSEAALAVLRAYDPERVPVRVDAGWFWLHRDGTPYGADLHAFLDRELRERGATSELAPAAWFPRRARARPVARPPRPSGLRAARQPATRLYARARLRPARRERGTRRAERPGRRLMRLPHRPRWGARVVRWRGQRPATRLVRPAFYGPARSPADTRETRAKKES